MSPHKKFETDFIQDVCNNAHHYHITRGSIVGNRDDLPPSQLHYHYCWSTAINRTSIKCTLVESLNSLRTFKITTDILFIKWPSRRPQTTHNPCFYNGW